MRDIKLILDTAQLRTKNGVTSSNNEIIVEGENSWDAAHKYKEDKNLDIYIEPEIEEKLYEIDIPNKLITKSSQPSYLKTWPLPPDIDNKFVWHLHDDYSELKSASIKVWNELKKERCIKIAHIDTGYQPNHPALPKFLNNGISFVKGEEGNAAIDIKNNSFAEQEGHGTATMSILAGRKIYFDRYGISYQGQFGAIPFAEIIPIRISETVALIQSQNFSKAIRYAINQGCEVVSMSMAGVPTKEWAKVVNDAYEAGITLVTAAGNSWNKGGKKLLPKKVLYPARWDRVIAATGVTSNHLPYIFKAQLSVKSEGGETMQGNYGPQKAMASAIAAYTPNTPWATMNEAESGLYYRFDGGGTSTATPQVAAAVALWLSFHRVNINKAIKGKGDLWKKVEAVKYALYNSADKSTYSNWEKYYGQGILKANKALEVFPDFDRLKSAKKAKATLNGILDLLGIMLRIKNKSISKKEEVTLEMFSTEILQELHLNSNLHDYLDFKEDDELELWTNSQKSEIINSLKKSPNISISLKFFLETL